MDSKKNLIEAITKRLNGMNEEQLRVMYIVVGKMEGGDT